MARSQGGTATRLQPREGSGSAAPIAQGKGALVRGNVSVASANASAAVQENRQRRGAVLPIADLAMLRELVNTGAAQNMAHAKSYGNQEKQSWCKHLFSR